MRALRLVAPLAVVAGLVLGTPALAAPAAPAIPTPAVPADLPAEMDPLASYQGQGICDQTPKPGTDKLTQLIKDTYPDLAGDVWAPRDCSEGNRSEHKEYRAIDWMIDASRPAQFKVAQTFLRWLLATDATGNRFAMARRLGVMYIGWNNMIWEAYTSSPGWTPIDNYGEGKPCTQTPQDYYDTAPCHRDHIHISLSWNGAQGLTSFWGGNPTPLASCPRWSSTEAVPLVTKRGLDFEIVKPVRVYDSSVGIVGTVDPCRLSQLPTPTLTVADDGSKREHIPGEAGPAVYVPVLGYGRMPSTAVRAVAVRIGVRNANAPASVYAWTSGAATPAPPILRARQGVGSSAETVVPVSSDGTIAVAVDAGDADVTVDVIGYFVRRMPDVPSASGSLTAISPAVAYTTKGSVRGPLKPGETRLVSLAGRGGLPAADSATPAAAVWLSVTTSAGRVTGSVVVARPHTGVQDASSRVPVRRFQDVTGAVVSGVDEKGRITLTNSSRTAVHVDITATGWSGRSTDDGGLLLPVSPVTTLDTVSGQGVLSAVRTAPAGMKVKGVGSIPTKDVDGVIARLTLTAGATTSTLSMWPVSDGQAIEPTLSAGPGETRTGLVLLPVSPAGGIRWLTSAPDANVRVEVVGVLRFVPAPGAPPTPPASTSATRALSVASSPLAELAAAAALQSVTVPLS